MTTLEQCADALRQADAKLRGLDSSKLLPLHQLNTPERTRWLSLAEAAELTIAGQAMTGLISETVALRDAAEALDSAANQLEAFGFTRSAMRAHDAARKARTAA